MKHTAYLVPVIFLCCEASLFPAELSFEDGATQHLRELTSGDTPGVAVLAARDGKIVFQDGFGMADLDSKEPITTKTRFRIGSISKQFTAAAVLRLAEQDKLSLDDPLEKYFSGFAQGSNVTVRQLLTHTSGIHSYTDKPEFMARVTNAISPDELIAWFRDDPQDFAPGAGFHYDNSGYFLLGEIVAQVSGKPFEDYLRETFFEPLGMNNTGTYKNSAPPPGMARGYSYADGKYEPALDWDMSWASGAGALYSTVGDLFLWNEALFNGRVLNSESFKAATTPVELPDGVDGMNYGYGLVMSTIKGLPAVGHGGGLNGWSSDLLRLPEQHCTIVVLANVLPAGPGLAPGQISRALAEKLLADEIKELPPLAEDKSVDPKSFKDYAGSYDYQGAVMTVSVEGDALFARLTGQPKFQIFPKGKDEFFWKVTDAQVVFLRDENGQVNAARHSQGGNTFRAPRLAENAFGLTPEKLDAFVGQYQYGPGAVMTVSRDGTQLLAQLTGQPRFPIFPKSETEYEWRVVQASVRFVKDDDGKVTKAVHTQNGNTFDAPKIK